MTHKSNSTQGEGLEMHTPLFLYREYNVTIKDLEKDPLANLLPSHLPGPLPPHPHPIIILESQTG